VAQLPSWVIGEEHKPAPGPLLLVQSFANTLDVEEASDLLADADAARPWLEDAGLLTPEAELDDRDLELARRVRDDFRAMLGANNGVPLHGELEGVAALARDRHLMVEFARTGGIEVVAPSSGELGDGLLRLLLAARDAQRDGTWSRLRLCANDECRWAFYDSSRNRSGTWCRMDVCGNRLKNRRLRARRARA
jgi:CGNR zinc finger/Putative stress-induced transcription regulator